VVCLSVCLSRLWALLKWPFGMWDQLGRRNHVLDGGPDPLMARGNFCYYYCYWFIPNGFLLRIYCGKDSQLNNKLSLCGNVDINAYLSCGWLSEAAVSNWNLRHWAQSPSAQSDHRQEHLSGVRRPQQAHGQGRCDLVVSSTYVVDSSDEQFTCY